MAKKQSTEPSESNETKPFVNPFTPGVSYNDFIEALGDKSVSEYCGDALGIAEIAWLEREIESHKLNNK